ncbi:DUF3040 domain-containing protein [Micromonosporaceae bacterium Da 78-11]
MATEDKRQFDEIAARLTAESPRLRRTPGKPWPRSVLIFVAVAATVGWALLSISMVVWGAIGVLLTCTVVAVAAVILAVVERRRSLPQEHPQPADTSTAW